MIYVAARVKGCANHYVGARSLFYYVILFIEKFKDATLARASVNRLLNMDETHKLNAISAVNLVRTHYMTTKQVDDEIDVFVFI